MPPTRVPSKAVRHCGRPGHVATAGCRRVRARVWVTSSAVSARFSGGLVSTLDGVREAPARLTPAYAGCTIGTGEVRRRPCQREGTGAWNRTRAIRVPRGNGTASASEPDCRGCWLRRVRRLGAVRPGRTGRASWNRGHPGPRGSDLQVPPFFGLHVRRVEDRTGQVDQVPLVQKPQHLLVQASPDSRTRPDGEAAMRGRLRRSEARRQCPPGAAADQHIDDRGEDRLIIDVRDSIPTVHSPCPAQLPTEDHRRRGRTAGVLRLPRRALDPPADQGHQRHRIPGCRTGHGLQAH